MKPDAIRCVLTRTSGCVTISNPNSQHKLVLRDVSSADVLMFERMLERAIEFLSEPQSRPGCDYQIDICIDPSRMLKSWFKRDDVRLMLYPDSEPKEFQRRSSGRRSKRERYRPEPAPTSSSAPSVDEFFSTQPPLAVDTSGPRRKRGQMVWAHKTAPEIEIEGDKQISPEDLAKMRRR